MQFSWDWNYTWTVLPLLLQGLRITVLATFFGSIGAFVLGFIWTVVRMARVPVLGPVVDFIVQFIRGTPLLIQLYFLFFVLPHWGIVIPPLLTGIIALSLFQSSYVTEIYRAGIEDLAVGQWEAAQTLGLPIRRVWIGIVLPHAIRTVLPVMGNVVIAMFKETALLSTITVFEMMGQAKAIGSMEFRYVEPLTMVGALYFSISYLAARLVRNLEKRSPQNA